MNQMRIPDTKIKTSKLIAIVLTVDYLQLNRKLAN